MSVAHIKELYAQLLRSKWRVSIVPLAGLEGLWHIENTRTKNSFDLVFTIYGNRKFGAWKGDESFDNAISCRLKGSESISVYFGKFSGEFQWNLTLFVQQLNAIASNDDV
ncbi:hypothetical protein [Croceimicrobium hydrocarbonivorans]|uniref:Uncharacterized protein n=1 Tax=Croceimicrobium hydrocarbonivorans TaxID=2761580 RepID=A0A7H0VI13_9FLAO|nr:hypothetical protein [Croceimicrobium hydrocarbonivorans]QNR25361.1 hypothetical protein H4K34_05840 [Croceimicrobium hydrocarbonivorans]